MTPEQIKKARQDLGLTAREMGALLDINDPRTYRAYEAPTSAAMHRKPPARMLRLLRAYIAGYRPADWPSVNIQQLGRVNRSGGNGGLK